MASELVILINDEKGNTVFSHATEVTKEKKAIILTQLRYLLEMINNLE